MEPVHAIRPPNALKALTQRTKPAIDIVFRDEEQKTPVYSYTTLDKIEGEVSVTAPSDMRFDNIQITFEGIFSPRLHFTI